MKKKITKSLSFCLALVLMLSMFSMATAAAEHVHNYVVTNVSDEQVYFNDQKHQRVKVHLHLCSCGDKFYETHGEELGDHVAVLGSQVNKGSYWDNGYTYTVYQYTCRICNHTYTKKEVSISKSASVEQAE